ncbi:MAG: protein translocase subunit SecD [Rhodospirillales bacterium]|nr:MAG: protein translocase subunit SecD [Rhodospirillales bacterium]
MVYFSKWKVLVILAVCLIGFAYASPNVISRAALERVPDWLPNQQVALGLDLQGGSHLLLEVETEAVIRDYLEVIVDSARNDLREARIRYTGLGIANHGVVVNIMDADRVAEAARRLDALEPDATVAREGDGRLRIALTDEAMAERRSLAVQKSVEVIRRRIDETGVREPTIQPQGTDRILVQLPGVEDPERMKELLGQTAQMTFHLVDPRVGPADALAGDLPPGSMLVPSADEVGPDGSPHIYVVRKRVVVSGENLIDAQPTFQENRPVVSFRFDSRGAQQFGTTTRDNVGQILAIVLDDEVISAPRIREPILGGSGVITGNFTVQGASDLALLLRAGALPAPLTILEERTVGPGLGADSIEAGRMAAVVGLVAVLVFMVAIYGFFGILANVALLMNLVLIMAVLSLLQATLTLPGIAGIVLTIGMAVDANVLIFERIREEVRAGRTPISAIDAGYSRALSTIIDANVTTLIAAVLLYIFGSGPVRGFAVTLAIGICTSLFTAIMLTRMLVVGWLRRTRPQALPI